MTRLADVLSRISGEFASIGIIIMTTGVALDVILRTSSGTGIAGMIEAVDPLLVIVAFLGLGMTERKGEHVAMSMFVDRMSPRIRYYLIAVGVVGAMGLTAWIAVAGFHETAISVARGEVRPGIVDVPLWPARAAVVVGCTVLFLQFAVTLVDAIKSARLLQPVGVWAERTGEPTEESAY
jgi:TRAP-type C4-dicarboxylate transport system permease small subunit